MHVVLHLYNALAAHASHRVSEQGVGGGVGSIKGFPTTA